MEYANWWPSFKNPDWKDRKPEAKARGRAAKKDKDDPSDPNNPRKGDKQERYYFLDAPPRTLPKKRYCDITGYPTPYKDKDSGLHYLDAQVFQYSKTLSKSTKDQYLSLRGVDRSNPLFPL